MKIFNVEAPFESIHAMRFVLIEVALVAFFFMIPLSLLVYVHVGNVITGKNAKERFGKKSNKIKKIDESMADEANSKQFAKSLISE